MILRSSSRRLDSSGHSQVGANESKTLTCPFQLTPFNVQCWYFYPPRRQIIYTLSLIGIFLLPILLINKIEQTNAQIEQQQSQQQQQYVDPSLLSSTASIQQSILPPLEQRPNVSVNLNEFTRKLSAELNEVSVKTNCLAKIKRYYANEADFVAMDAAKMRDQMLSQINELLNQHKTAVNNIVSEAERLAASHNFVKTLRFNYTDVHRLRNELDPVDPSAQWNDNWGTSSGGSVAGSAQVGSGGSSGAGSTSGTGSGTGQQFTSINGGTPVPGPLEWQTPIRSYIMQLNKNFGDIPVNTSYSAVHLPLPIYAGLPEIMNGIAWSEKLDQVFRRNLLTLAHINHQCYGDHLGFLRTFPAHKWRIPRSDPDLFDARVRPWYIAGVSAPKDVVILVDTSGSMTGLRREIAKGVVFEILDTLTNHDHFSVMRFSESVTPVGLPKCQLRTPKLGPALEEQCRAIAASGVGGGQQIDSRLLHECNVYWHNWEQRDQYLRDHPDVVLGKNGSYLTDELYHKTVVNVTQEIKDAYLLPATSRNIRYLKSNFTMPTAGIANFTNALMAAFELLQAYNRSLEFGSHCNQAIMLITDGAIKSHEDIFNRLNYPNSPVRVFTYMIGREVGDITHTKAMACSNRGYYTHVINLGEVREQVQKYLPVMARPLVLSKQHPVSWTHVYGDETYQVLTDWVLEIKRRERARIMLNEERERLNDANSSDVINIELTNIPEYDELAGVDEQLKDRIICENLPENSDDQEPTFSPDELDPLGYNELACHLTSRRADLMTSVVKPVFDSRNTTLVFERVLHKNIWTEQETYVKNAQLLGVASVDLRIADIMQVAPSHLLGPNGYALLMGQNGFLLSHPDFRALLEDPFDKQSKILKPHFASVDLTHVEQVNEDPNSPKRRIDEQKLARDLRESALKREKGIKVMTVKRAIDCRRRPQIKQQTFYYGPVKDTPFSFMIALPTASNGSRLVAKAELSPDSLKLLKPSEFDMWTVHPDYKYCEGSALSRNSSDTAILQVLEAMATNSSTRVDFDDLSVLVHDKQSQQQQQRLIQRRMVCDRELFPSLLFDAAATYENSNADNCGGGNDDSSRYDVVKKHGVEISFLATRSGLTRVRKSDSTARITALAKLFIQHHSRGVDESWYSRAVDYNMRFSEEATIISAPYNAHVRLIAKLRQRITQQHPAANDKRANCDPLLVAELDNKAENDTRATSESNNETGSPEPETGSETNSASPPTSGQEPSQSQETTQMESQTEGQPTSTIGGGAGDEKANSLPQQDEPLINTDPPTSDGDPTLDSAGAAAEVKDYNSYSTFDFLDLIANSSVHISAFQSVIVNNPNNPKQRSAVAVAGLLHDYATFARGFLNATSLDIRTLNSNNNNYNNYNNDLLLNQVSAQVKINICPDGKCPTRCGLRNDSIDCLLVDNNGFIVVGEELPHIGRSLMDYDEKLMQSLVERRVFYPVTMTDYQAICSRSAAEVGAPTSGPGAASMAQVANSMAQIASSSVELPKPVGVFVAVMANLVSICSYLWSSLLAATIYQSTVNDLGSYYFENRLVNPETLDLEAISQHQHLHRSPIGWASAQSAVSNQSLLAQLPNKTYLRPCEKQVTYYETRPSARQAHKLSSDTPEYYATKCGCSAWYVYESVPKTNLIMLIVNTTTSCRRGCDSTGGNANFVPVLVLPTPAPEVQPSAGNVNAPFVSNNKTQEDQVCAMLERDSQLYSRRSENCVSYHPEESQIHICGSASRSRPLEALIVLITLFNFLLSVVRLL